MTRNDVLIIGAGPSGLFAAAELARHGVEARLVERDVQPHREARATAIQPGTLEILNSVGLLAPFRRCGRAHPVFSHVRPGHDRAGRDESRWHRLLLRVPVQPAAVRNPADP